MDNDVAILELLKGHDSKTFIKLCHEYFKPLEAFADSILNDPTKANKVVTNVLGRLWAKGAFAHVSGSLREFLIEEIAKGCHE